MVARISSLLHVFGVLPTGMISPSYGVVGTARGTTNKGLKGRFFTYTKDAIDLKPITFSIQLSNLIHKRQTWLAL